MSVNRKADKRPRTEGNFGRGDADPAAAPTASSVVDKIFGNDKVGRFTEENKLSLGVVSISKDTREACIHWDEEGWDEDLYKNNKGHVVLKTKIGVFDRKVITSGSRVTNAGGSKVGTVREKRVLVTAALENEPTLVIEDIPVDLLIRCGPSRKHDKIVYKGEWVGLVLETKVKLTFRVDKNGDSGVVVEDNLGPRFPISGDKMKLSLGYLWDADWKSSYWMLNIFKYLGDPASIENVEVDCISVAWMGRIASDKGDFKPFPKNILRGDEIHEVAYLYGNNRTSIKEHYVWQYPMKEGDALLPYHTWADRTYRNSFFGISEQKMDTSEGERPSTEAISVKKLQTLGGGGDESMELDSETLREKTNSSINKILNMKIVLWRTVVDVEWDDGTLEMLPIYGVKPHRLATSFHIEDLVAGDLVQDRKEEQESTRYGMIISALDTGIVFVKWVTPNPHGTHPVVSSLTKMSKFDLLLKIEYMYLRELQSLPVVIPVGTQPVEEIRIGIAVGTCVEHTKMIVRSPNGEERLVWAHDFKHFERDVKLDLDTNKWTNWMDAGTYKRACNSSASDNGASDANVETVVALNMVSPEAAAVRPKFQIAEYISDSSLFLDDDFSPRKSEAAFHNTLNAELRNIKQANLDGIWIETYKERADLFMVVIRGPVDTPYEDHLLVFELKLNHDFPLSSPEPHFFSNGFEINPCINRETGRISMPESALSGAKEGLKAGSSVLDVIYKIINNVLVKEPYFLLNPKLPNDNSSQELNNFIIMRMLENTADYLQQPPDGWESFFRSYYRDALPKIISRAENHIKHLAEMNPREADSDLIYDAFILAMESRIKQLQTLLSSTSAAKSSLEGCSPLATVSSPVVVKVDVHCEAVSEANSM